MPSRDLQDSSYVVLGLVELREPATVYELKQIAHSSTFNFWAMPHTALYTESERLKQEGLLTSTQERSGRRRRRYSLTEEGRRALEDWRQQPAAAYVELRDPGLVKLFFGGDRAAVAADQLERHSAKLAEYEELRPELDHSDEVTEGMKLALEAGIAIEREYVRFWRRVAGE